MGASLSNREFISRGLGIHCALAARTLIVEVKTFTLFVLSPGVENPAAQAGIDCSFCASDTRLRRGPGQDRTALVV